MKRYAVIEKNLGETPLMALESFRQAHPEYRALPLSYAGRLDPMAEGALLILIGNECKRQDHYRNLDKEYVIEVLFDLGTDTGDVLGLPRLSSNRSSTETGAIARALKIHTGTHSVPYPAFSSKPVGGKPLFEHALTGSLDREALPHHEETIYGAQLLHVRTVSSEEVQARINDILTHAPRTKEVTKRLGADFRQDAVRDAWTTLFSSLPKRTFTIATIRVTCGSGTYMRTLAERLGQTLGTDGLALSIRRTHIGTYLPFLGTGIWTKRYR